MADDGGFTVTIHDKALKRAVRKMERRGLDQRPAWKTIADAQWSATMETFEKEGARDGQPKWEALKQRTLDGRQGGEKGRDTAGTAKILQDTKTLKGSIDTRSGRDFAAVGTALDYAQAHQEGVPSRNLPARPFLFVTGPDLDEAAETILDYITGAFA